MNRKALVLLALVAFAAVANAQAGRRLLEEEEKKQTKPMNGTKVTVTKVEVEKEEKEEKKSKTTTLAGWKQCGGLSSCKGEGKICEDDLWPGFKCEKDYECVRQNQWFYQCEPSEAKKASIQKGPEASIPKVQPSDRKPLAEGETARYQQCGGSTGNCQKWGCQDCIWGDAKCEEGFLCNRLSAGYYQCDDPAKVAKKNKVKTCAAAPKLVQKFGDEGEDYDVDDLKKNQEPAEAPKSSTDDDNVDIAQLEQKQDKQDNKEPSFIELDNVEVILAEDIDGKKCGPAVEGYEVDGTYMGGVFIEGVNDEKKLFSRCCDGCRREGACVAFQVNSFANATNTCEYFSAVNDVVPAAGVWSGVVLLPEDSGSIEIAGK